MNKYDAVDAVVTEETYTRETESLVREVYALMGYPILTLSAEAILSGIGNVPKYITITRMVQRKKGWIRHG